MTLVNTNFQKKLMSLRDDVKSSLQKLKLIHDIDSINLDELSNEERQYTFLWSAYLGQLNVLQHLLTNGANLRYYHLSEHYNALHLAALSGSLECVQWLLGKGCPISRTSSGLMPLHFAAYVGSVSVCRELIKAECPLETTTLNASVYSGSIECVKFFLHEGCPVNEYDDSGNTPLHIATEMGNVEILKVLLHSKLVNLEMLNQSGDISALHIAAEYGYDYCMRALLENGADVNGVGKKGTALHIASKLSLLKCVEVLLDYKADVNIQDDNGHLPLHLAISQSSSSMPILRAIVERGKANLNVADKCGFTALHLAATGEFKQAVEYLIENGANVAAVTNSGITALNFIALRTPDCLKAISRRFSQSISHKEQNLKLNFQDILSNSTVGETELLYVLQDEDQSLYLQHPLCRAFLYLKWQKIRRFIVMRVILYSIAAIALSYFILVAGMKGCKEALVYQSLFPLCKNLTLVDCKQKPSFPSNIDQNGKLNSNCTIGLLEECILIQTWRNSSDICNDSIIGKLILNIPYISNLFGLAIVVSISLNLIRLIFSLPAYVAVNNSFHSMNVMEIVIMVDALSLWLLWLKGVEWNDVHIAFTILSSWLYVTLICSQLPFFGMHITMFLTVLKHLIKTVFAFFCLLAGFTFTFCVLKGEIFQDPVTGFVQTMAMMTGELNANDMIKKITNSDRRVSESTALAVFAIMILVMIVLMNLSVGLAISDVEGLRKTAELQEITSMSKLIFFIEKSCFDGFAIFHRNSLINKILRMCLYVFPDLGATEISLKTANPHEKRLPKEIIDAAIKATIGENQGGSSMYDETLPIDHRIGGIEIQLARLQASMQKLNENLEK